MALYSLATGALLISVVSRTSRCAGGSPMGTARASAVLRYHSFFNGKYQGIIYKFWSDIRCCSSIVDNCLSLYSPAARLFRRDKISASLLAALLISPHTYWQDYSLTAVVAMLGVSPPARVVLLFHGLTFTTGKTTSHDFHCARIPGCPPGPSRRSSPRPINLRVSDSMHLKPGFQRTVSAVCLFGSLSISFIAVLWVIVSRDRIDIVEALLVLASVLLALALPKFGARTFQSFDRCSGVSHGNHSAQCCWSEFCRSPGRAALCSLFSRRPRPERTTNSRTCSRERHLPREE